MTYLIGIWVFCDLVWTGWRAYELTLRQIHGEDFCIDCFFSFILGLIAWPVMFTIQLGGKLAKVKMQKEKAKRRIEV